MTENYLCLEGISKHFGPTKALNDVSFRASRGSIHAILGENGAGKSTLMKILAGVMKPDEGKIAIDGQVKQFDSPASAAENGVVCIFQELSLIPHLSAAQNICLAKPPKRWGLIDSKGERSSAKAMLDAMGFGADIVLEQRCADMPLSKRQIVEIAKAVIQRPRVLILDEATSALPAGDVEKVLTLLRRLKSEGMCILYISHRMAEVDALADTCSVFRNGAHVATFPARSRTPHEMVQLMIGREVSNVYPPRPDPSARRLEPYTQVKGLRWGDTLRGMDFSVSPGEIVGLGGLDGQGQREVMLALGGVLKEVGGSIRIGDRRKLPTSPADATRLYGIAMVPEERKVDGLFVYRSVSTNLTASVIRKLSPFGVIRRSPERKLIADLVERLQIKVGDARTPALALSGGNQQKVLLGKWLATNPKLLLLMDPTRGIDVGTKQEIYRMLRELAQQGMAILLYSSDYDELIGLCDRVLVMYGGAVRAELAGPTLTEHNILLASLNVDAGPSSAQYRQSNHVSPFL